MCGGVGWGVGGRGAGMRSTLHECLLTHWPSPSPLLLPPPPAAAAVFSSAARGWRRRASPTAPPGSPFWALTWRRCLPGTSPPT